MANILNFFRMLFKRRQHKRYNVRSGTFVIVSPGMGGERKVQVIDISMGGVAFIYKGHPEELENSGIINLLPEKSSPGKLEFDTVSDIPAPGNAQPSDEFRRRGVKFKWLGLLDKSELNQFIENVSTFSK